MERQIMSQIMPSDATVRHILFENDSAAEDFSSDESTDDFDGVVLEKLDTIDSNINVLIERISVLEKQFSRVSSLNLYLQNKQYVYELVLYVCLIYNFFVS